jgi:hypothetical protein
MSEYIITLTIESQQVNNISNYMPDRREFKYVGVGNSTSEAIADAMRKCAEDLNGQ